MAKLKVPQISLAVKCQLLFGMAVVLIIAASLLVPWLQMQNLVDELHKRAALRVVQRTRDQLDLKAEVWTTREPGVSVLRMRPGMPEDESVDPFIRRALSGMVGPNPSDFRLTRYTDDGGKVWYRYVSAVRDEEGAEPTHQLLGVICVQMEGQFAHLHKWNNLLIATAGMSAGLLAILVFYLIVTKLILSPVRDLRLVAEQVSKGDLQVRSSITTADEFEELSDAFNRMLSRLQDAREELETINRSLDTRLGELAQTNVALYESHRLQSEFLANVSHELRTPLSSIIGFAELLRDAMPGAMQPGAAPPGDVRENPERIHRYADNILMSGRSLLDLINDLLDLAKIEAGRMQLHRTRFRIGDVCDALLDFTRPLAAKKDLRITLSVSEDVPDLYSDAGKVQQILFNLLSNAIKFTPERGTVHFAVERADAERVRIYLRDTGPGIEPEHRGAVFEKFRQVDGSMTRQQGGTGLGLPISKELAGLLGGTLGLQSEVGAGSTFTLTIPIECPEQTDRALVHLTG